MATDTPTEQKDIPILHDVVARGQSELYEALQAPDLPEIGENELALLQTELASRIHQLAHCPQWVVGGMPDAKHPLVASD